MTVKEFGVELKKQIKKDVKKAWIDIKAFGSEHPYVTIDIGMLAAAGLFYTILFDVLDKAGYEHTWIKR